MSAAPEFSDLPAGVRLYLNQERMLGDEILAKMQVRYCEFHGKPWLAFPVRSSEGAGFHKLKGLPGNDIKGMVVPSGSKAALYAAGRLGVPGVAQAWVCEGEPDCLLLLQAGFAAVTSTAGASTFREEWLTHFPKSIEVVLCFDNDAAGDKGREKVRALLLEHRPDLSIADVRFNYPDMKKGYDVTDFWRACLAIGDDPAKVLASVVEPYAKPAGEAARNGEGTGQGVTGSVADWEEGYVRPVASLAPPEREISYEEWKALIVAEFPDLIHGAEVCMSVVCQLLINDVRNPFALVLVDAPASGKTITLNFFDGLKEIMYASDNFSPAALVSQASHKSTKALSKIDMLPRIRFKTLIVREMAAIFSERDDDLRHKLGIMTRVLDGEGYVTDSGVHGQRGYQGDYLFMFLGASTPLPLRVWRVMGSMGHRLFFLSLGLPKMTEDDAYNQLLAPNYKEKEMRCKKATHAFLRGLWTRHAAGVMWDASKDDLPVKRWIARASGFLARFRGEIIVYDDAHPNDSVRGIGFTVPNFEQPSRIQHCMLNLARGHALAAGRTCLEISDLEPVFRVVFDSAPHPRPAVLRELLRHGGTLNNQQLTMAMGCMPIVSKKEMKKLIILGLCHSPKPTVFSDSTDFDLISFDDQRDAIITLCPEYQWLVQEEFQDMMQRFNIKI